MRRQSNTTLTTTARTMVARAVNYFQRILQWIIALIRSIVDRFFASELILDSGRRVRIGKQIAEGGFSFVFEAVDTTTGTPFALKRIRCDDRETLQACRKEAAVHNAFLKHKNLMPLLGMAMEDQHCFMLFPYLPHSLRAELNLRIFEKSELSTTTTRNNKNSVHAPRPPWNENEALHLFRGILEGVATLHKVGYTHRDIKPENILFSGSNTLHTPILMDFGSVGPLIEKIDTKRQVLELFETASSHTTMPYRPPELFEGEVRAGDGDVDFVKVDVWMLGCTLYAILYGTSPFECEFHRSNGMIKVVDCTQLRVIGNIPYPPSSTPPFHWYSTQIKELIGWMLTKDRFQRPTLQQVINKVDCILGGEDGDDPIDVIMNRGIM